MKPVFLSITLILLAVPSLAQSLSAPLANLASDEDRIGRLEVLADLWARLWLFHPTVVTTDIDWDQALIEAIPPVENARSTEELIAALNQQLFAKLNDPLSTVLPSETVSRPATMPRLSARRLSSVVGYVNASNPDEYWENDFPTRFHDALSELGEINKLIVDMRFPSDGLDVWTAKELLPKLLNNFVEEPVETGSRLLRVHRGWNQANHAIWGPVTVYDQKWDVEPGPILQPDTQRSPIAAQVVFVVNNTSMPIVLPQLDALQSRGKAVVIWEKAGTFPTLDLGVADTTLTVPYSNGVTAYLAIDPVLSPSGELGARPDYYSDQSLSEEELLELAGRLRPRARQTEPTAARFSPTMRFPDIEPPTTRPLSREERLLGLFKLWFVLDRFFPHLEYADLDWPHFLREAIPPVEAAEGYEEYYRTLQRLTAPLNDSHVFVWHFVYSRRQRTARLPIQLRLIDGKFVVAARAAGVDGLDQIRLGDVLLAVGGRPVEDFVTEWSPLISASTPGAHDRDLAWSVELRETPGPVELQLDGPDGIRTVTVPQRPQAPSWDTYLYSSAGAPGPAYSVLPGDVGYINLHTVKGSEEAAMEAVASTRGLILDGRVGPGSPRIARFVGGDLIDSSHGIIEVPTVSGLRRDYVVLGNTVTSAVHTAREARPYVGPVVVLIDAFAQSSMEGLLTVMNDTGRVTFVGGPTAGTNGNATQLYLPGGGFLSFTGMRIKHHDGARFQNIGIKPDVEVYPTIEGIRAHRDEVLERGVEVLQQMMKGPATAGR